MVFRNPVRRQLATLAMAATRSSPRATVAAAAAGSGRYMSSATSNLSEAAKKNISVRNTLRDRFPPFP